MVICLFHCASSEMFIDDNSSFIHGIADGTVITHAHEQFSEFEEQFASQDETVFIGNIANHLRRVALRHVGPDARVVMGIVSIIDIDVICYAGYACISFIALRLLICGSC